MGSNMGKKSIWALPKRASSMSISSAPQASVVNLMQSLQNLHCRWTFFGFHGPAAFHQAWTASIHSLSFHFMPCHFMSSHLMSFCLISCHFFFRDINLISHGSHFFIHFNVFLLINSFVRSVSQPVGQPISHIHSTILSCHSNPSIPSIHSVHSVHFTYSS